jgi:hypothetical protein
MQVFGKLELHAELRAGRVRREDLGDGAGFGTQYPHHGARLKAGDLRELGVHDELPGEGHLPVADHEEPNREQDEPAQDERADPRKPC